MFNAGVFGEFERGIIRERAHGWWSIPSPIRSLVHGRSGAPRGRVPAVVQVLAG
jgi:hypothetical protein